MRDHKPGQHASEYGQGVPDKRVELCKYVVHNNHPFIILLDISKFYLMLLSFIIMKLKSLCFNMSTSL